MFNVGTHLPTVDDTRRHLMSDTQSSERSERQDRASTPTKPVQRRLLIPLAGVLLFLIVGFSVVIVSMQQSVLKQAGQHRLKDVSDELATQLIEQSRILISLAEFLQRDGMLVKMLKARDRQGLLAAYEPSFHQLQQDQGVTHFYFHGPDRVNLLRLHNPTKHGDLIDRFTARKAERTGKPAWGSELGPLGTFTLRAVWPVVDNDGLIGYVELGKEIEDILVGIHQRFGTEMVVSIHKEVLNRVQWEEGMSMLGRELDTLGERSLEFQHPASISNRL